MVFSARTFCFWREKQKNYRAIRFVYIGARFKKIKTDFALVVCFTDRVSPRSGSRARARSASYPRIAGSGKYRCIQYLTWRWLWHVCFMSNYRGAGITLSANIIYEKTLACYWNYCVFTTRAVLVRRRFANGERSDGKIVVRNNNTVTRVKTETLFLVMRVKSALSKECFRLRRRSWDHPRRTR